jgi:hypothetical protein
MRNAGATSAFYWADLGEKHPPRFGNQEENMMKTLIGAVLIAAFVTPALAADEFYVVQDVKTKKCTIVDKRPTTTETTVVGNGMYKTRVEAETGMKTVKVCTTN